MKKLLLGAVASLALIGWSATATADEVAEVFTCTVLDGKTLQEVQAVNKKWLDWMHANVSEKIRSSAATPLVGDNEGFLYVDTYPDLATWAAGQAALQTDAGQAVEAAFGDVMTCSGNRLWRIRPTE